MDRQVNFTTSQSQHGLFAGGANGEWVEIREDGETTSVSAGADGEMPLKDPAG